MTAQIHERLNFDGEVTSMAFCPPIPLGHPRILTRDDDEAARDGTSPLVYSTACWRGYLGTWEIRDGRFYLIGIEGRYRLSPGGPLLADWFTGVLRIPRGERLQYVHMGFESVYEQEVHVAIERGVVVATQVRDNRGRRHDDPPLA